MSRKTIYDLLKQNSFDPDREYLRLRYLLKCAPLPDGYDTFYTNLYDYINDEIFNTLPIKKTSVNLKDLLRELNIDVDIDKTATLDDLFNLAEFILHVADTDSHNLHLYNKILDNINIILEETSHRILTTDEGKIIIPKDAKIEQAALLIKEDSLALEILNYKHRSNIGNIENKKRILARIGMHYEPSIKQDQKRNKKTVDAISFILNNLNIRHNNETKNDEYMKIIGDDLEQWYDDLYSLFICYIIENEKNSILEKVDKLKKRQKNTT